MINIYKFDMDINFLLESVKIMNKKTQTDDEANTVFVYIISTELEELKEYKRKNTIISFENDLELFINVIDKLLLYYEVSEEFERCDCLYNRKKLCELIMKDIQI